jgi:NAD(P)-dependent dehydrogenase (short-subunit alcohol dehydrogenase family)
VFAREGARLSLCDRHLDSAQETAALCRREGAEPPLALHADMGRPDDVHRMIDETLDRFGRIDVLVNNAGYGLKATVAETSLEEWNALMAVNVTGVFLACRQVIPVMARQGGGVIVNVASVTAHTAIRDRAAYCASKGAVAALTRAMAIDHVEDNVRVNAIAPGTIHTPYFDEIIARADDPEGALRELEERQAMKRLGRPEEIADGILYLACEESSFCTGTLLTVDGGMTAY